MKTVKGSWQRPMKGKDFRKNYDSIFRKFYEEEPTKGEVVDGHEYLGKGGWHAIDQQEPEMRDKDD